MIEKKSSRKSWKHRNVIKIHQHLQYGYFPNLYTFYETNDSLV